MPATDFPALVVGSNTEVRLGDLVVRPELLYRLEDKTEIAELADSIEKIGLLHNLVITNESRSICSGTRRYGALSLKCPASTLVSCKIIPEELGAAMAAILVANAQVKAPDPMRDSALVSTLLAQDGWTLKDVAIAMGWEPRRVALLKQLQNLVPEVVAAMQDQQHYMRKWPIEWIEEFSLLSAEAQQESFLSDRFKWVNSKDQLDRMLAEYFHLLGKAPWDLNDVTLVPTAGRDGSCVTCPDHSGASPGLFDAQDDGDEKRDVKSFMCQNALCWQMKNNACALRKIAEARQKNPDTAIVVDFNAKSRLPALSQEATYTITEISPCNKSEKGAVPALTFTGDGAITKGYIRKPIAEPESSGKPRTQRAKVEMSDAEKLQAKREKLEARRQSWVVSHVITSLRDWDKDAPSHDVLLGLVVAYRVEQPLTDGGLPRNIHGNSKARMELYRLANHGERWGEEVWPRVARDMILSISGARPETLDGEFEEAIWIAETVLETTAAELKDLSEKEIPTPKALLAAPKKPKAEKKPVKAKKGKKEPTSVKPRKNRRAEDGFAPEQD